MTNVLNARNLKNALWETLNSLTKGEIDADVANSIASQSREILRTVRMQVVILEKASAEMTKELTDFAG